MIGFFVLVGLVGVACVVAGSVAEPQPRKRLPPPTRDHQSRLLALVERVEAADRRVEAGCGLEQCSVHDVREAAAYRVRHPKMPSLYGATVVGGVVRGGVLCGGVREGEP